MSYGDEKFVWSFDDVDLNKSDFYGLSPQGIKESKVPTFYEKLDIGDIVALKGRRYLVQVVSLNFQLSDTVCMDYVGKIIDFNASEPVYFNQYDVVEKRSDSNLISLTKK